MPTNVTVGSRLPDTYKTMFAEYLFPQKIYFQLFALGLLVMANETKRRSKHKSASLQQVHEKRVIQQTTGRGETAIMP